MSRRDLHHDLVTQALISEGWTITHDPYYFESDPELATDLGAERMVAAERETEKFAVEIKTFGVDSQVVDLERAIGQYMLYEEFLKMQEPDRELYLAVPSHAFEGIFARQVGQVAIKKVGLKLIVFSLVEGEDLLWNNP
jgi:hypothetical protein